MPPIRRPWDKKAPSWSIWQVFIVVMSLIIIPWTLYVMFHSKFSIYSSGGDLYQLSTSISSTIGATTGTSHVYESLSERQDRERREKIEKMNHQKQEQALREQAKIPESIHKQDEVMRNADGLIPRQPPLEPEVQSNQKVEVSTNTDTKAEIIPPPVKVEEQVSVKTVVTDTSPKVDTFADEKEKQKKMNEELKARRQALKKKPNPDDHLPTPYVNKIPRNKAEYAKVPMVPVVGPLATNGMKPLYGKQHQGGDAVFALACKYPKDYFQRFVGSLRKFNYDGDIVLAVSPPDQMKPGLGPYLQKTNVVAYPFEVNCEGTDNCQLKDEFLGYPDPRPFRTFANIRYALYEYWMQFYSEQSYILILDFRDTFFQANPFASFGYPIKDRVPKYDLQVFAENYKVKNIGKCVFNSMWVGRCFSKAALESLKHLPVICSGSTLGSYSAIRFYLSSMLTAFDTQQCWLKGIESDQGYQNYLFHKGMFNTNEGNATMNYQGHGVVNTIGAMNGFRVPKDQKGPLDTFWKIRDSDGFVLNYDGNRSACIHQWDRFADQLTNFVDSGKIYDFDPDDKKNPNRRKKGKK